MLKMHYFSNKFSKIAKRWGLNCGFLGLIVTKSNFKRSVMTSFCDVIAITSTKWRYQNNVTKFFHFGPPLESKFSATPVHCDTCFSEVITMMS